MRITNILIKLVGALALLALTFSCTDDTYDAPAEGYGFVQFKLVKNGGLTADKEITSRAANADILDSLADAKKIKITLKSAHDVIEQTLALSATNGSDTEMGLWSEKCQLLADHYNIAGYELLDNLGNTLLTYDVESEKTFEVVSGGMVVETINVNVRPRGTVKFQLVKDFSAITRTAEAYRMDKVAKANITVKHKQTGELITFENMRTNIEYYYESESEKTYHSKLVCDTILALKAGDYIATSFIVKDQKDQILEAAKVTAPNGFSIADNKETVADVPITMQETAPSIHDGIILKKIWEALDGPNWSFRGVVFNKGCNWEFDRDIDLWIAQPGVMVLDDGHVASISLGGFGARGHMPEELGELSELRSLILGSHNDAINSSPINKIDDPDELIAAQRADFKQMTLDCSLAEMAPEMWNVLPDKLNEHIKDFNNCGNRSAAGLNMYANNPNNFYTAIYSLPASIGKLKKLTSLFIANSPIASLPDELSQLENCTDVEIYNCPNLKEIPKGFMNMPKLQMVYFVNNNGITSDKLYEGMVEWTKSASKESLQGLYFMNNNLKRVPDLRPMKKLGFLDMQNNQIEEFEAPFGKDHNLGTLNLSNNHLKALPRDDQGYFAGFEAVETWSFAGNEFTEFPDIFDADSPFLIGTINFSQNKITSFEKRGGDKFHGLNVEILNLSFNPLGKFPGCIYESGTKVNYLVLRACNIREFPEEALEGDYVFYTMALDLAANRIKTLPKNFNALKFPYMSGLDLSSNAFDGFAYRALDLPNLQQLLFRGQRDDNGYRCMKEWPTAVYAHHGLKVLYLGSNDIRRVVDYTLDKIRFGVELTDNPNISIDLTTACPYITAGLASFLFDSGQDVRGCDAVVPKY